MANGDSAKGPRLLRAITTKRMGSRSDPVRNPRSDADVTRFARASILRVQDIELVPIARAADVTQRRHIGRGMTALISIFSRGAAETGSSIRTRLPSASTASLACLTPRRGLRRRGRRSGDRPRAPPPTPGRRSPQPHELHRQVPAQIPAASGRIYRLNGEEPVCALGPKGAGIGPHS
jgi:hypothetical protein